MTATDPAERAREICLRLLAERPRTRAELAASLRRHRLPPEVIEDVLQRYAEVGIIDDRSFARAWVTSRHHGRGLARRALSGELRRKGVDPEIVRTALDELDQQTEIDTARALVARRLEAALPEGRDGSLADPTAEVPAPPQSQVLFRRLVGMLARKGYPPALAFRVVREAMAERPGPDEFVAEYDEEAIAEEISQAEQREADARTSAI